MKFWILIWFPMVLLATAITAGISIGFHFSRWQGFSIGAVNGFFAGWISFKIRNRKRVGG